MPILGLFLRKFGWLWPRDQFIMSLTRDQNPEILLTRAPASG